MFRRRTRVDRGMDGTHEELTKREFANQKKRGKEM